MKLYVDNPNTEAPRNAVLCSPLENGQWRVYMPEDIDIPAWLSEIPTEAPQSETVTLEKLASEIENLKNRLSNTEINIEQVIDGVMISKS